ncbi:UNVERIFIED_CONTAM: Na+-driven multidrug efflux pump [Paenibacillus sp. PvR008]
MRKKVYDMKRLSWNRVLYRNGNETSVSIEGVDKWAQQRLVVNVIQSLNGTINSIWVGKFLGESALTAASNRNIIMFFLISAIFGSPWILRVLNTPVESVDMAITYTRIIFAGMPMGLQMIAVSSSAIALMNLINGYGTVAAAAYTAANNLSSYVQMPAMALGAAVSSFAAQNIGAGRWDRVRKITWIGIVYNFVLTGGLVVLIYIFNREALLMFLPSSGGALELGMRINLITLWSFIIFGITNVITGVVRSTGSVIVPLLIIIISLWGIRIPLAYAFVDEYGLDTVWWSFPVGFAISAVAVIFYYAFRKWKQASMRDGFQGVKPVEDKG